MKSKFGAGWWTKFQKQLDSIDNSEIKLGEQPSKRLSFNNVSEIVADSSYSAWVNIENSSVSLALYFQYKDTLAISHSPECWLMYPYNVDINKIVVYWDNNIDTKYNFDIIKTINKTEKNILDNHS